MNKKIIILVLVIFCTSLIVANSVFAASTVKETVNIKNGVNNLLEPYSETALKGKFHLNVGSSSNAYVTVSNYKKLVGMKVSCYFLSRTTHMDKFGRPSHSTVEVNRDQFPNGYSVNPRPETKKTSKGYNSVADFSYAMTGGFSNPGVIYSIELEFEKQPDLKLEKVTKKNGKYIVKIKNAGDSGAKSNKMGIFVGKKRIKTITVPAIKAGKSKNLGVSLPSQFNKNKKTFRLDYNNKIDEIFENNNAKTIT